MRVEILFVTDSSHYGNHLSLKLERISRAAVDSHGATSHMVLHPEALPETSKMSSMSVIIAAVSLVDIIASCE